MEKNIKFEQNTPLWDNSLSIEERLDYLSRAMTLERKIHCLTTDALTFRGLESGQLIWAVRLHTGLRRDMTRHLIKGAGADHSFHSADRYECEF